MAIKERRINLRVSPPDEGTIRKAAEVSGTSVTEFVTSSALERAHNVLADQRTFVVDDATWDAFLEILDRTASVKPRLASLLAAPSPLD